MCYLCVININAKDSDSDDDMAFSQSASDRGNSGFAKIAVRRDVETGEITGWQDFYNMAREDNPNLV